MEEIRVRVRTHDEASAPLRDELARAAMNVFTASVRPQLGRRVVVPAAQVGGGATSSTRRT